MSLLLMSRTALRPFYFDKLNIRIWSGEELCWCIMHYPLLASDGLVTDGLIDWIRTDLGAENFAEELEDRKKAGESTANLLLVILQMANYYSQAEVRAFRNMMLELTKKPKAELLRETAKSCTQAGRLHLAAEKYEEAAKELTVSLRSAKTEEEALAINDRKADVYCDLACVRMLMFDETGALKVLDLAEGTGRAVRAEEYRYLINGSGQLSEEEKAALREKRDEIGRKAADSPMCRKIAGLTAADRDGFLKEAAEIVREWKKEYRRTS